MQLAWLECVQPDFVLFFFERKSKGKLQAALIRALVVAVEKHYGFIAIHFQNGSSC